MDFFKRIMAFLYPPQEKLYCIHHTLYSNALQREVRVDVYLPPSYYEFSRHIYPSLYFNDGQDMSAIKLEANLQQLWQESKIHEFIVIAIHANKNRLQEYGTAEILDYKNRGSKAYAYEQFMLQELFPLIREHYRIRKKASQTVIAGFSLGGLSALNIAWRNPTAFGKVGIFSGSLWWRSKQFRPSDPDADRIMHGLVRKSLKKRDIKFWFQTGTKDETSDRNNNGIIDSIDDTNDLILELEKLGYQSGKDIRYVEVLDGEHNQKTWARILPDFLIWAFGKSFFSNN